MFAVKDGGPAFPLVTDTAYSQGMSLRHWYAGLVFQALVAKGEPGTWVDLADTAWRAAGALIVVQEAAGKDGAP